MVNLSFDKIKTEKRKSKLRKMYQEFYCSSDNKCKHYEECARGMYTENGYDSSYAAKVADNYDIKIDGKDTRIVIIGKECPNKNDSLCTPAKLADFTGKDTLNAHYRETFKMLKKLLNYNPPDTRPYRNQNDRILEAFALTNIYRCAFKEKPDQRQGIKNNDTQTKNCLKILKEELNILEPTVLVFQAEAADIYFLYPDANEAECTQLSSYTKLFYSNKNKCYIIKCPHPRRPVWNSYGRDDFDIIIGILRDKRIIPIRDTTSAFDE